MAGCTRSIPDLVRGELEQVRDVPVTVPGLLAALARFAGEFGRTDLVDAARWLAITRPGRPRTLSATATCTRSTCSRTATG
jgi:hypothetical protein